MLRQKCAEMLSPTFDSHKPLIEAVPLITTTLQFPYTQLHTSSKLVWVIRKFLEYGDWEMAISPRQSLELPR